MNKPFVKLSASDYRIHPQYALPHVEGYRPHKDIELSKEFPRCCDFHIGVINVLEKWFENDFPHFTKEEEEAYEKWFKKSDYTGLPLKIITQLSYTEYFIDKKINNPNWYEDIRHYIEYNERCFGTPPLGSRLYVYMVKVYLENVDKENVVEKRNKIIAYLDKRLNPQIKEIEDKDNADINVIYATIQKWLKAFPFDFGEFSEFKKYFERKWLVILGVKDYNPYTGMSLIKTINKSELITFLITTTKNLLLKIHRVNPINASGLGATNALRRRV